MNKKKARIIRQKRNKYRGQNEHRFDRMDAQTNAANLLDLTPFSPPKKQNYRETKFDSACAVCDQLFGDEEISEGAFDGFTLFNKDYFFHTRHFQGDDPATLNADARETMYLLRLKLAAHYFPEKFRKESL